MLALLAEADVRGRICDDQQQLLEQQELYSELCREHRCLHGPRSFPSDHTRFLFFRSGGKRYPDAEAHDDTWGEVVLMAGLPGAGKDHWIRHHLPGWPVVSLDDIRDELKIPHHRKKQGRVVQEARQRARALLRRQTSFVWNVTAVARDLRGQLIELFASYGARIRVGYVEPPLETLLSQNRHREHPVPEGVIFKMLQRLREPDLTDAHTLEFVVGVKNAASRPATCRSGTP